MCTHNVGGRMHMKDAIVATTTRPAGAYLNMTLFNCDRFVRTGLVRTTLARPSRGLDFDASIRKFAGCCHLVPPQIPAPSLSSTTILSQTSKKKV